MATSYNGWTASREPAVIDIDKDFTAAGRKFPGGVKRGPVSVVLKHVIEQFNARVEPVDLYDPGDEWGYVYKPSANSPKLLSCHSSGTAVDINATRHPNGKRGTFTQKQVDTIRAILREVDGVVRWLGDTSGTPDEMHFEIRGTETDVARVAGRLLQPIPDEPPEDDMPPSPAIVVVNGVRFVFVLKDGGIWWKEGDSGFARIPGGTLTSAPAAVDYPDTTIEVVSRGTDGAAWSTRRAPTGGWSAWVSLGGQF